MISLFLIFCVLHTMVWFGTVYQFAAGTSHEKALLICVLLAIPTSIVSFYACRWAYEILESAWSVRLFGFAAGYLVFPLLTWVILNESPFNFKTIVSIILAITIVVVQVFIPDS